MSEVEQIILPEGFKRVEYLQSTGNEYLYLPDLTISSNDTIEWKQKLTGNTSSIDGVFSSYNYNEKPFRFAANYISNSLMINLFSSENNSSLDYYKSGSNFILSKNKLIIDNETISENFNFKDDEVTGICIFTQCIGGTYYNSLIRLYYWEVKGKCKLIPCLDANGNPCMYDLVSRKPFYNQGSGRFLISKDIDWPNINNNYNLPAGFKKCVYLQSDGTQWINTGVIPDNETGLYFNALQLSYGNFVPFGVGEGGNEIYPPQFSNKDLYYRWGTSGIKMMAWDKADDLIFHSSLNLYDSKIAKFDSKDTDAAIHITSQPGTYTLPIWLFSYNSNGSYNSTYGKWIGRIYRAQITQRDSLIHDYVPCLDADNRPCMYDLIEQEALYNQSGGTEFTYCVEHQLPSDFVKLKYLESNSDLQHIKTGYIPTNNTGMYVDAYNTVVEDRVVMGMQNTTGNNGRMWIGGVMKMVYGARYGWGTIVTPGGTGDVRFEASLNWLNDKKSIITCAAFAQRVNTLSDLTFIPNQDIYIFGWNRQGSLLHWKGRIYRAKISEGTEIVRDFVPAYDQRILKPCMYDLINNVAYYNDGTGEFLYNRDFEGNYKGYSGLGCIANRLGGDYNPINEKLPSGYTRIDFLEATGTQYITTDVYATGSMKFELEFLTKDFGGLSVLYGVFKSGEHSCFYNNYNLGYGHAGRFIYGPTYYYPVFKTGQFQVDTRYKLVVDGHEVYRNGDKMRYRLGSGSTIVDSIEPLDFVTSLPISVFAHTGALSRNSGIKRMYYFRASDNGVMKLNFIPAIDDKGKPCMFDLVTQQPYYNLGTGEDFKAGLKSMSHALQLCLPETGGTITLSLPTNDTIEYYEEKIRANNPNWTISFQYH